MIAQALPADPAAPHADSYAGLVTRTLAFATDAAVINLVAITVGVIFGLALSIFSVPDDVETALVALGAVLWAIWSAGYFIGFWATTGQTPGSRLMRIRVCDAEVDRPLPLRRAAVRLVAMMLAAIPLFAGFVPILFDDRRRGFHDRVARTVVVHEPEAYDALRAASA